MRPPPFDTGPPPTHLPRTCRAGSFILGMAVALTLLRRVAALRDRPARRRFPDHPRWIFHPRCQRLADGKRVRLGVGAGRRLRGPVRHCAGRLLAVRVTRHDDRRARTRTAAASAGGGGLVRGARLGTTRAARWRRRPHCAVNTRNVCGATVGIGAFGRRGAARPSRSRRPRQRRARLLAQSRRRAGGSLPRRAAAVKPRLPRRRRRVRQRGDRRSRQAAAPNADSGSCVATSGVRARHSTCCRAASTGTSTTLASSHSASAVGTSVRFTATVTADGSGVPSGAVVFFDGDRAIGTAAVHGPGPSVTAVFATLDLAIGDHQITAEFHGSHGLLGSRSQASPRRSRGAELGRASRGAASFARRGRSLRSRGARPHPAYNRRT